MLYEIHHVGDPADSEMSYAMRPYFRMKHPDHAVYQAEMQGKEPVMTWVDDDTRAITLYFVDRRDVRDLFHLTEAPDTIHPPVGRVVWATNNCLLSCLSITTTCSRRRNRLVCSMS
jgi:hypothetical protein